MKSDINTMLSSIEEQDRDGILTQEGKNCMSERECKQTLRMGPKGNFHSLAQPQCGRAGGGGSGSSGWLSDTSKRKPSAAPDRPRRASSVFPLW
jgi:hypothetical protein